MHRSNEIGAALLAAVSLVIALLIVPLHQSSAALGCDHSAFAWYGMHTNCHMAASSVVPAAPARLTEADEIAALDVVNIALNNVPDGTNYIWQHTDERFEALIRPTQSFKDNRNRVCRHVVISFSSGSLEKTTEGVACREEDGVWTLEG